MTTAFPLSPVPSTYGTAVWNTASQPRNGIFYQGGTAPVVTLSKSGATSYQVRDITGTVVSSGAITPPAAVVTPTAPGGGWPCGWYRIHFYGPANDSLFGTSYCITNFQVIPNDSHFLPTPLGNVGLVNSTYLDPIVRGVLAVGPSRLAVFDPRRPTIGNWTFAEIQAVAALAKTYWTNPGAQYLDPGRPRRGWCAFPNGGYDSLVLPASVGTYVTAYCKDGTVDAAQTYVSIAAGSVSGAKIIVYHGTTTTTAETYDNLANAAAAMTAINGVSSYIRVYGTGTTPGSQAATAIGRFTLPQNSINGNYLDVWCLNGANAATTYVALASGSVSGTKITVYSGGTAPGNIVETYDNLASNTAAATAINGTSTRIAVSTSGYGTQTTIVVNTAATAISTTFFNGVKSCVSTLYDANGITAFEGPSNEPEKDAECAIKLKLFHAAVKAGNASALVMGPCFVDINDLAGWARTLDEMNVLSYQPDIISSHAYGAFSPAGDNSGADMNVGRVSIAAWKALLATKGFGSLPIWQTESTQTFAEDYGVHRPRRACTELIQTLVWEEQGCPREYNPPWYDINSGFWDYPTPLETSDYSVEPQGVLHRTLAAETWGQNYRSRITFPGLADKMFAGWLYDDDSSHQTLVFAAACYMQGATITVSTNAAGPLTLVDSWGNTSTVTVSGGQVTLPALETPKYLRLPFGATCAAVTVNGWSQPQNADIALGQPATVDGVAATVVTGGSFASGNVFRSATSLPSTVKIVLNAYPINVPTMTATHVIVWCGNVWQTYSTLVTFTVESSLDGVTWTSRGSFDNSAQQTSFLAGADSNNTGTQRESYAPDTWIMDIDLGGTVTLSQLRLTVTNATFGGLPDQASYDVNHHGDEKHVVLQRVAIIGQTLPGSRAVMTTKTFGTH